MISIVLSLLHLVLATFPHPGRVSGQRLVLGWTLQLVPLRRCCSVSSQGNSSLLPSIPAPQDPGRTLSPTNPPADGCRRSGEPWGGPHAAPSLLPVSQLSTHTGNGIVTAACAQEQSRECVGEGKGSGKGWGGCVAAGFGVRGWVSSLRAPRHNTGFAMTCLPPGAPPGHGWKTNAAVAPSRGEGAAVLPCRGRGQSGTSSPHPSAMSRCRCSAGFQPAPVPPSLP